jgi:hypothetical protein
VRPDRLAGACVGADGQPLPPDDRDAAGESGGGDALVPDDVDDAVQPASPAERAPFCLSFPKRRANFGNESEIWVAVARAVWEQTTVDTTWLAEHLHLRSAANASQQIRRHRQQPPELSKDLQRWMIQSRKSPDPYFRAGRCSVDRMVVGLFLLIRWMRSSKGCAWRMF